MKPLRFELVRARRWPVAAWALVAAAVFVAADSAWQVIDLGEQVAEMEKSAVDGRRRPAPPLKLDPAVQRDAQQARQIAQRLSLPWDELFQAIESASNEKVALLAVEPDSQRGEVTVSGEAADYLAIVAYLNRLNQPGTLHRAHLLHHELRVDDPHRPMRFAIAASWKAER